MFQTFKKEFTIEQSYIYFFNLNRSSVNTQTYNYKGNIKYQVTSFPWSNVSIVSKLDLKW